MRQLRIDAVAPAPPGLFELRLKRESLELVEQPVPYLGFTNYDETDYARLESMLGDSSPITRTPKTFDWWGIWYYGRVEWISDFTHQNKKNGSCQCGERDCLRLGIWHIEMPGYQEREQMAVERRAWLEKVRAQKKKARAYNQARKERLEAEKAGVSGS